MEKSIEERFDRNYDNLTNISDRLGTLVGYLYEDLKNDSTNEKNREVIEELSEIARMIINAQRDLVDTVGTKDEQFLHNNLDYKEVSINDFLSQLRDSKTR